MNSREYRFDKIISMINPITTDFFIKNDKGKNTVLSIKSNKNVNKGVSIIRLPFEKVYYSEYVVVNAIIKNNTEDFGTAFCGVNYYKKGERILSKLDKTRTVTGGELQFYGNGFKDYQYYFIIPQGVDSIEFYVSCRNSGSVEIKNLEVYVSKTLPSSFPINTKVKCVAHQGMPGYAPLNTMPSFYLAKRAGFRECVINTNYTKDGQLVVIHNNTIDESSNGSGLIHDMTLNDVMKYDFGSFFNEAYTDTEIPLLDDVINMMAKSGMKPVLRLSKLFKEDKAFYLEQICEMIRKYGLEKQCTAKAFSKEVLNELSQIAGDIFRYGYCCYDVTSEDVEWIKTLGSDVYFDINYKSITDKQISLSLENDIPVETWIINDFEAIIRLAEKGVSGFTNDFYCLEGCLF